MIQLNNPYTYFAEYAQSVMALLATFIILSTALEPSSNSSRSVFQTLDGIVPMAVGDTPCNQTKQPINDRPTSKAQLDQEKKGASEKASSDLSSSIAEGLATRKAPDAS